MNTANLNPPCADLNVLDLSSGIAGPLAGRMLADLGATVIAIAPPGGHRLTWHPAMLTWQFGKQRRTLDLKTSAGQAALRELAAGADVLIESFRPHQMDAWDLGYVALTRANPNLVYAAISGWGPDGPMAGAPADEGLLQAYSGIAARQGGFRPGPVLDAVPIVRVVTGLLTAVGILGALVARARGAGGQRVDTSLLAGALAAQRLNLQGAATLPPEKPVALANARSPVVRAYRCADGRWIQIACNHSDFLQKLLIALDRAESLLDPRWQNALFGSQNDSDEAALIAFLAARFQEAPATHWLLLLEANDVPCAPVLDAEALWQDPRAVQQALFLEEDHPELGRVRRLGPLFRIEPAEQGERWTEDGVRSAGGARPPLPLGEGWGEGASPVSDAESRSSGPTSEGDAPSPQPSPKGRGGFPPPQAASPFGRDSFSPPALRPPSSVHRPLEGMRVVECSVVVAAPYVGRMLSELGAEVVKLEPLTGDFYRKSPGVFLTFNAGKRSLRADLQTGEGRAMALRLLQGADVFLHNWRPGVAERIGLGQAELRRRFPGLIYTQISAFGSQGPFAQRPGFDGLAQALTGIAAAQGGHDNPPNSLSIPLCDIAASLAATVAALGAILHRERTGSGALVETSLMRAGAAYTAHRSISYAGRPPSPELNAGQWGFAPGFRIYPTADGWVFVSAEGGRWPRVCAALALDGTSETAAERGLAAMASAEAIQRLAGAGVAAQPVRFGFNQHFPQDPQVIAQGLAQVIAHPVYGEHRSVGPPIRLSRTPLRMPPAAPALGQDTIPLLTELGYTQVQIHELAEKSVIGLETPWPEPNH